MKAIKFLLGLGLMVASSSVFSQGLQGIVVEKYYQAASGDLTLANAEVAAGGVQLTTGSVTYRVYADLAAGYKLNAVYGNAAHPITISATTGFYNHPNYGGVSTQVASAVNIRKDAVMLDSYLTMGQAAAGQVGVLKSEDTNGSVGNAQSILTNNPGGCFGLPLTTNDGFAVSSASTLGTVQALGFGASALNALDQTNTTTVTFNGASIAVLGGLVGATNSNMVLIGQFTTDGLFSFSLNVQVQPVAGGAAEYYVSSNPTGSEQTHPTLTYVPNVAPTVSMSSVTGPLAGNTNVLTGTVMTLEASASDAGIGTVTGVEFFVNGVSVGVDNTATSGIYSVTHTASVAGAYVVTAAATDNDCVTTTTSTSVSRTIASNIAPTVSVSAPATAVAGSSITLSATASDNDGVSSVAQVEFFVNNVSVGVDNSSPYSISYTAVLGSGQIVKAVATDNGNPALSTTSTTVTMNVLANVPPTVSIASSPLSTAVISSYLDASAASGAGGSLAVINLSASASDYDGIVTQVQFFVDGNAVGSAITTAPYTYGWNSTSGTHTVVAKATDSNGAVTTSSSLTFQINDILALPYEVVSVSQTCEIPTYCVPVKAAVAYPVDNVKGYDVVMDYNVNKVHATGAVTVANALVNPALIDVATSVEENLVTGAGQLIISLSFKGSAPASSEFNGFGELFCAEFTRNGIDAFDQTQISVSLLQESYVTQVMEKPVTPRLIYSTTQQNYVANLEYGFDGTPIVYDPALPNANLVTNIYGSINGTTISNPLAPVVPNTSGVFTHNFGNGTNVSFERDINNAYTVQTIVNASDAVMLKTLLINGYTSAQAPSIYQMLAMDVNLDGVISSGDLTQMKQRTTLNIPEYMQAWNYSNAGVSNGQPSKDFTFVDATRVATAAYQKSATFPANDGVGYSKAKVPVVPFILPAHQSGYSVTNATCPIVLPETYKVVMLGDVNGSYGTYVADGLLKSNDADYILVDLNNVIVEGTKVSVPVSFISEEPVNAFDIALEVNDNRLSYVSMEDTQLGSESESFYNTNDKTLRYTALNLNEFSSNGRVSYFTFETVDGKITEKDLKAELGLLNGKLTEVRFTKSADLVNNNIDIYPNPSNGMFTVMSHVDGQVDIVDITGKLVFPGAIVKANQVVEVNMPELSAGVYFVRFYSNDALTTKRIVISE